MGNSRGGNFGWFAYGPRPVTTPRPVAVGVSTQSGDGGTPGPDPNRPPELGDLGRLVRRGVNATVRIARADERPTPHALIVEHLGDEAAQGAVTEETWAGYESVNVQVAVDAWLAEGDRAHRVYGLYGNLHECELADLVSTEEHTFVRLGNVSRRNVPSGPDSHVSCVAIGLYLVDDESGPMVLLKRDAAPMFGKPRASVQVLASDEAAGRAVVERLRALSQQLNVFRGQVLSFGGDMFDSGESILNFHERPDLGRESLILQEGVLEAIERQVIGVATHRERLAASGQHLKRGVLLYGPPGVGKTHTVRYLTGALPGVTFVMVSGEALQAIDAACSVARSLQPSVVVVEDVDLIAEDRGMYPGQHPLLFQLLNEMDGVGGDVDVAFVLTTNRADLLEPALAQRPGRIDEAVEIGLPDAACRRRLFDLYVGRLRLEVPDERIDAALRRAEGVTASFLKEWLRRCALAAAERESAAGLRSEGELTITGDDLDGALDALLETRGRLTRVLLGAERPEGEAPGFSGGSVPVPYLGADAGEGEFGVDSASFATETPDSEQPEGH